MLYLRGFYFLCRHCHELTYPSKRVAAQRMGVPVRRVYRALRMVRMSVDLPRLKSLQRCPVLLVDGSGDNGGKSRQLLNVDPKAAPLFGSPKTGLIW